jgi:TusE/DsrC/DsvC family sulfur relay protein
VPEFHIDGRTYEVDEDGFLQAPELWNEEVAKDFARTQNVNEMTEEHWTLVRYIRNYYEQYGIAPMERKLSRETGFSPEKMYQLFPSGPAKGACKVAGLPGSHCAVHTDTPGTGCGCCLICAR